MTRWWEYLLVGLFLLIFIPWAILVTIAFTPLFAFGKLIGDTDLSWWSYFTTFWQCFLTRSDQ